jgi:hypothetical protein
MWQGLLILYDYDVKILAQRASIHDDRRHGAPTRHLASATVSRGFWGTLVCVGGTAAARRCAAAHASSSAPATMDFDIAL